MDRNSACIAWLAERCHILSGLLAEPEMGMASWALMYGKEMNALSDFWLHGWDEAKAKYEARGDERLSPALRKAEAANGT